MSLCCIIGAYNLFFFLQWSTAAMIRFALLANLIVFPIHLWAAVTRESSSFPTSTNGEPFPWNKMRLPVTVSPLHYHLLIHPNLTSLDFTGMVLIQIEVHENTKNIILHSKDLHISNARLLASNIAQLQALKVLEYPYFQQIALISEHAVLKRGHVYSLQLEFAANLSESFHGFYKSTYHTSKGDLRWEPLFEHSQYLSEWLWKGFIHF